jgi:hypothetical protein
MSRKDFILIAETIRLLPSFETYQQDGKLYPTDVVNFSAVCRRFAEALSTTNPRFKTRDSLMPAMGRTEDVMSNLAFAFPQPLAERYQPQSVAEFVGLEKPKRFMESFARIHTPALGCLLDHPVLAKRPWLWQSAKR